MESETYKMKILAHSWIRAHNFAILIMTSTELAVIEEIAPFKMTLSLYIHVLPLRWYDFEAS